MSVAWRAAASKEFILSNPITSQKPKKDAAAPDLGYLYPLYLELSRMAMKQKER